MVWHDFDKWNKKVQNTMGYQIIRSSDSIAANIAEGYGRYTPADRKKFYLYSRGSLTVQKYEGQISNFYFPISTFCIRFMADS
jgi:four helix bundle protein